MGMAEDIAQIRFRLDQMDYLGVLVGRVDVIHDKLRYDIEPKLDKALEGKIGTEAPKTPDAARMLHLIRLSIIYVKSHRKIDAIKAIREATGASLQDAKATAEWMESFVDMEEKEAE